jgi:hypothetical protein
MCSIRPRESRNNVKRPRHHGRWCAEALQREASERIEQDGQPGNDQGCAEHARDREHRGREVPVREVPRDVRGERARSDDQEDRRTDDCGGALHDRSVTERCAILVSDSFSKRPLRSIRPHTLRSRLSGERSGIGQDCSPVFFCVIGLALWQAFSLLCPSGCSPGLAAPSVARSLRSGVVSLAGS